MLSGLHHPCTLRTQTYEAYILSEAFLSAYPWRYAFDATIGTREPRGTYLKMG